MAGSEVLLVPQAKPVMATADIDSGSCSAGVATVVEQSSPEAESTSAITAAGAAIVPLASAVPVAAVATVAATVE
jgi:hypothetical protein